MSVPILLLGRDGDSTRIVYNHLVENFGPIPAIIEKPKSRLEMLKIRIRKLGLSAVISQLGFMFLIRPFLRISAQSRIREIERQNGLNCHAEYDEQTHQVTSVNSDKAIDLIRSYQPKVIIVNGTRIISKNVLDSSDAKFINTHTGITPKYRGAHGGYWALYNGEPEQCGVTVHLVDSGIDTGEIIAQKTIRPAADDSFETYLYLQTAAALPLLVNAVNAAVSDTIKTKSVSGESAVWYHPGFFQYLAGRLRRVR